MLKPNCPICGRKLIKLEDSNGYWYAHPFTGGPGIGVSCILDRAPKDYPWGEVHRLEAWQPQIQQKEIKPPFAIYIDDDGETIECDDGNPGCGDRHQAIILVGESDLYNSAAESMSNIIIKFKDIEKYLK